MKRLKIPAIMILVLLMSLNVFSLKAIGAEHKLENLEINVFIDDNGSARITEKRVAVLNEGTENFIVIGNLGKSTIKDFSVEENGRKYDFIDNWNIKASREEKIFKNGIIDKGDGYELVWGIGEYGRHEYILTYTVTDFIKELEDAQILFWRFVNDKTNIPPENVKVTIESKAPIKAEEEKIWAFGYKGNIAFSDGKVIASSEEPLSSSDYLTILLKFPKGRFLTNDFINKPFVEIKDRAFEGSDYGKEQGNNPANNLPLPAFFMVIMGIFPILIPIVVAIMVTKNSNKNVKKFKRKYKEEYCRDYPYEGDILDVYHILYDMGLGKFENLLTSFILKWIKEGKIQTETEETGIIRKKEQTNIRFLDKNIDENSLEGELFSMMLDAAGQNNLLEEKEFTKWASKNRRKIEKWEEDVKTDSTRKLEELEYLELQEKRKFLFKTHDIVLTEKGKELEKNIYKYINYLYDYSLLNENEAVNVKIWDDIMVWAAILGITEVVRKQFKKLYPRYEAESVYTGNSIYLAHALTRNIARAAAPPSTTRSSGGGGFSSMGGGGGSFGGGSGGGTR